MTPKEIYELLKTEFKDKISGFEEPKGESFITVNPEALKEVMNFLKNSPKLALDSLMCLSGMDYPDKFTVVYHLYSTKLSHRAVVKVNTAKDKPTVPSVSEVWAAAEAYEREAYDMFGIEFSGHPNLTRVLMPEDWVGYPLRKDYQYPESYHGIPCNHENTKKVSETTK